MGRGFFDKIKQNPRERLMLICNMGLSGDVLWMLTVLKLNHLEKGNYAISILALHEIACFSPRLTLYLLIFVYSNNILCHFAKNSGFVNSFKLIFVCIIAYTHIFQRKVIVNCTNAEFVVIRSRIKNKFLT